MRALKWLACIGIIILTTSAALGADKIPHQRGIELRGSFNQYLDMSDPNSFVAGFVGSSGYSQTEFTEADGALGGGLSLLYKSEPYFAWHVGFNVITGDSASSQALNSTGQVQTANVFMRTTELFFTANYYLNLTPRFNLEFGAGPAFYLSSLDRVVSAAAEDLYGDAIYGAHGRSFGFLTEVGLEFFLTGGLSLQAGGGFRWAPVNRFKYYRETPSTTGSTQVGEIVYWNNTFDTFQADFSGAFADIGLRVYFDPVATWDPHE